MERAASVKIEGEKNWSDPTAEEGAEKYDADKEMTKDEWVDFMIEDYKLLERREQRADDVGRDNGLRLFSRQKKQSKCTILLTLFLLTLVYVLQLICMYNLFRQARSTKTLTLAEWFERGYIKSPDVAVTEPDLIHHVIRTLAKNVEGDTFDLDVLNLPLLNACFTRTGYFSAVFNVVAGLVLIYAFLFFEMWSFIMDTPITRSFPGRERNGIIMVIGELWLVILNSAIVVWLGVISGYTVLASCLDFFTIMNTAFSLFIIIAIDDTVVPGIRFLVEEHGHIDIATGELKEYQLRLLTHGKQYYKPGYGQRWTINFRNPNILLRLVSFFMFIITISIVLVPFAIIAFNASSFIIPCSA